MPNIEGGSTGGYLLFSFLLFSTRYVRYLMVIWCNFFMSLLISFLSILSFSNSLIRCS